MIAPISLAKRRITESKHLSVGQVCGGNHCAEDLVRHNSSSILKLMQNPNWQETIGNTYYEIVV